MWLLRISYINTHGYEAAMAKWMSARTTCVSCVCGYICIKIEREMRYVWNVTAQTHCIQSQSRPFGHLVSQLLGFSIDDYIHKQGESKTKMNRSLCSLIRLASIGSEHTVKYWKWVINSFIRRKKNDSFFRGIENMMKVSPMKWKWCDRDRLLFIWRKWKRVKFRGKAKPKQVFALLFLFTFWKMLK